MPGFFPGRDPEKTTKIIFNLRLIGILASLLYIMNSGNPKLSYSSINCNSLNMSTLGSDNHLLKIHGIVSLQTDIIFLSDIRLCNTAGISNSKQVSDTFRCNPYSAYKFFNNSNSSKRGVGILIKHTLSFTVLDEYRDRDDNVLGLLINFEGKHVALCAIYGPNRVHEQFFTDIRACINQFNCENVIVGGDWNCTVSCINDDSNIDILNMRSPPNIRHSLLLKKLCEDLDLSDPFRVKFPNRREFSYRPSDFLKTNRSRIDFFITSNNLTAEIRKCYISPYLQNKMFDHRAVHICFKNPHVAIRAPTISREILKDPNLDLVVHISIFETYTRHTGTLTEPSRNDQLRRLGTARANIREAGPDSSLLPIDSRTDLDELRRSGLIASVKETINEVNFNELTAGGFTENLNDDIFMETLVNNLRNDVVSYQTFISKTVKNTAKETVNQLIDLKKNYDLHVDEIIALENRLDRINDHKLRAKMETSKNFEILNNEKITPNFVNLSKGSKSEASLSDLRDDNDLPFESEAQMKSYVRNFYRNLYKAPHSDTNFNENCIREFLGEEIIRSPLVQDSIIPEQLSRDFEAPLTLEELDISVEQGNKSASGMDGLS